MIRGAEILAVGMNHRTAPMDLRERLAIPEERLDEHYEGLRRHAGLSETVILSTCNRVEIYAVAPSADGWPGVVAFLADAHGVRRRELERHVYRLAGPEAVHHLFRVAASLDSMVVGEPQILGQLKRAFLAAEARRAVGRLLRRLMHRALSVGKRVRARTGVGRARVSVGSAGVDLARQVFGTLQGRSALLVGAGEMAGAVCQALVGDGLEELVVCNRTYARAVDLADRFGGTAAHLSQLRRYLERVDILVASAGGIRLLERREAAAILRARRYRPLLVVDLAVPRSVDPAVNELEGAFVFNVDDLQDVARRGLEARRSEARAAEDLVRQEAERCYAGLVALSADEVIAALVAHAEAARRQELARSAAVLDALDPRQREVIEAMTRAMFKRFLHHPIAHARRLAADGDEEGLALLRRVVGPAEDRDG